jgi:hypothetical protein
MLHQSGSALISEYFFVLISHPFLIIRVFRYEHELCEALNKDIRLVHQELGFVGLAAQTHLHAPLHVIVFLA